MTYLEELEPPELSREEKQKNAIGIARVQTEACRDEVPLIYDILIAQGALDTLLRDLSTKWEKKQNPTADAQRLGFTWAALRVLSFASLTHFPNRSEGTVEEESEVSNITVELSRLTLGIEQALSVSNPLSAYGNRKLEYPPDATNQDHPKHFAKAALDGYMQFSKELIQNIVKYDALPEEHILLRILESPDFGKSMARIAYQAASECRVNAHLDNPNESSRLSRVPWLFENLRKVIEAKYQLTDPFRDDSVLLGIEVAHWELGGKKLDSLMIDKFHKNPSELIRFLKEGQDSEEYEKDWLLRDNPAYDDSFRGSSILEDLSITRFMRSNPDWDYGDSEEGRELALADLQEAIKEKWEKQRFNDRRRWLIEIAAARDKCGGETVGFFYIQYLMDSAALVIAEQIRRNYFDYPAGRFNLYDVYKNTYKVLGPSSPAILRCKLENTLVPGENITRAQYLNRVTKQFLEQPLSHKNMHDVFFKPDAPLLDVTRFFKQESLECLSRDFIDLRIALGLPEVEIK